jgi:hypothetical protein
MAISSNSGATIKLAVYDSRTIGLAGQTLEVLARSYAFAFGSATGAGQVNTVYGAALTLITTADTIDLSGSLANSFGETVTPARIKLWGVANTGTANLTITTTGTNGWTACLNGVVTLPPGGLALFVVAHATAWPVTPSTGDLIVLGGTAGQSYELFLLGANP